MFEGCYTALVTPMKGPRGREVDYDGLARLIDFQVGEGVAGILAMGTTGESPTLSWEEHAEVVVRASEMIAGRCALIAGTGSNCTDECLVHTRHAVEHGVTNILLVEPYYNGPSSLEISREYVEPIAREFPATQFIPYVIPGRTGTQLLPEDLARLARDLPNVNAVKEATGNLDNMRRTRELCGPDFDILSGDDPLTPAMMGDPAIGCAGTVSVISNVVPGAVQAMFAARRAGDADEVARLAAALEPLCDVVTVKTREDGPFGARVCKARNPLPIKTLMRLLGMPSGEARRPLGRMTPAGLAAVVEAAAVVWRDNPDILRPLADAFAVDVEERLTDPQYCAGLAYDEP